MWKDIQSHVLKFQSKELISLNIINAASLEYATVQAYTIYIVIYKLIQPCV